MSNINDFVIENGVLKKYVGEGGDVVIPDGVKTIGMRVFTGRNDITSIQLSENVMEIKDSAFTGCDGLNRFDTTNSGVDISTLAFGYGKTEKRKTIYLPEYIYLPNVSLASCSTAMQKLFFTACYFTCVERHSADTKIQYEKYAKTNKNKLLSTIIQNENISAMKNAVSLLVDETNVVSLIDEAKQSEKYEMASFLQDHVETKFPGILTNEKTFLTRTDSEFVIENGVLVEYIGNGGDVVIPDGVTTIQSKAIYFNKNSREITSIVIPDSVEVIEADGFRDFHSIYQNLSAWWYRKNTNLKSIKMPDKLANKLTIAQIKKYFDIDILVNALLINPDGFAGNFKTTLIKFIKNHNKVIVDDILRNNDEQMICTYFDLINPSLEDVDFVIKCAEKELNQNIIAVLLDYKNRHFRDEDVQKIYEEKIEQELDITTRTLAQWRKIFRIRIEDNYAILAGYKGNEEEVIIPSKLEKYDVKIATEAFKNCRFIESVVVPEGITELSYQQFSGCTKLKNISLPDSLKKLDLYSFDNCLALESIHIPKKVKRIQSMVFSSCKNLKHVYLTKNISSIDRNAFSRAHCPQVTIHAPAGSYAEAYAKENNIPFEAE